MSAEFSYRFNTFDICNNKHFFLTSHSFKAKKWLSKKVFIDIHFA